LVRGNDILALAIPEREVEQLLIVDDDPGVLNSLARVLTHRSKIDHVLAAIRSEGAQATNAVLQEDLISVQVAPSPHHALKIAASADFACVITDYQMPEMNGIEFLKKFSALQPDCMSLLFSSEISKEDLIDAVESANIFAFIDQPWTDFELKVQVALALSRRRILRENRKLAELVSNSKPLN
jgi:DNA-binding NtrC family response regulator